MESPLKRYRYWRLEHRRQSLLPRRLFLHRLAITIAIGLGILIAWVIAGVVGYHALGGLAWVDAFLNAAMIVGGMGPVDTLHSASAKLFAGFYAILSGVVFLSVFSLLAAPIFHRFLHRFHLEAEKEEDAEKTE
jgi:hypothetical protein